MRGFKFDDNFNLDVADGKPVIIEGRDHTLQKLRGRLLTRLGTLFYNTTIGLDFDLATSASVKNPTDENIRQAVQEVAQQDLAIEVVNNIRIDRNRAERNVRVTFEFTTTGGPIIGEVII